ncbi:MAG: A/G-specific adenine glycosylase [Candidatus Faecivicinus sp.]
MSLSSDLLQWYDQNRRELPWRGSRDPYRIWLSEIMLQQTRTETVERYYQRFLERFPTVEALAEAQEDVVLKLWEGLGYYSRARNLHAAAKRVVHEFGGQFPTSAAELRTLPGVGPYAANAIASIAYGRCAPALDGNQARVLSRVLAHDAPLKTPFDLENAAMSLIDPDRPGDYNQALMDLGASVCTPKNPHCCECPIAAHCHAFDAGDPESFPRKQPPAAKREVELTVIIARCGRGIFVRRRPSRGLLGGLYEFPSAEGHPPLSELPALLEDQGFSGIRPVRTLPESKHVFTHLIWRMQGALVDAAAAPADYLCIDDLSAVAFPSALRLYREIAADLLNA